VELITNPSLIFLDEPTTGLDSFTAFQVIETLKNLARHGRTIITTIHQPNSEIYQGFDRLMLLSQGKIVYFNEARLAVDYFARFGPKFACPSWNNPADFFMDMLSLDSIETEDAAGKPKPRD
jgi:ATP-binding cassette, subfamily G (WHITE), eye pigment precursor transporter